MKMIYGQRLTRRNKNDIMITNNQLKENIYNETKSKHNRNS